MAEEKKKVEVVTEKTAAEKTGEAEKASGKVLKP